MTTDTLPIRRTRLVAAALLTACCIGAREEVSAGQFLGIGGNKAVTYRMFRDPAGRFEFEYPTKDWRALPRAGTSLAGFARNDGGATIAIDYARLTIPIRPSEIAYATMAEVEIQDLKDRNPQAKDFKSEVVDTKAGRGALIRYASVGAKGPERVIQYSVPIGQDLYRVIAIAPEMSLSKHEAVLMHMIESFKAPAADSAPKS